MHLRFTVTGMTCAACAARVEKAAGQVTGVKQADVNLLAGTMAIEADDNLDAQEIIKAVQKAGYSASLPGAQKKDNQQTEAVSKV